MGKVEFNVGPNAVIQLGEDLYKNTYGVLIEYITNSYDADATVVDIIIDRTIGQIIIKDDGIGMSLKELNSVYMDVGLNRRKKATKTTTTRGRLVTGRKGFGKLACFGLFKNFKIETVQAGYKSTLTINTGYKDGDFFYNAFSDDKPLPTSDSDGTSVYLMNNNQKIPENKALSESIAKRLNIMYGEPTDEDKFIIKLGDIIIDKTFRDEEVLNKDIKFEYKIPEHIERFLKEKDDLDYIHNNNIKGVIIAREKTVNIKENKGVVLFARGKLCQEATYLDINPSNSYGYAHLYAELEVDFIDADKKEDNIGTDRTALKETETTKKLFKVISKIMKSYATLYDYDEKERKINAIDTFKEEDDYKNIMKTIASISNINLRIELESLLEVKIKNSIKNSRVDAARVKSFQTIADSITPTYILTSEQVSKDEPKDNILTSYDHLILYLREKYSYTGNDGTTIINHLFGSNSNNINFSPLSLQTTHTVKDDIKNSMREHGSSIVNLRNSIMHTNNRDCINDNISIENSKRFLIMVDLFMELDKMFFIK